MDEALVEAAKESDVQKVKSLVHNGADVNYGHSYALRIAARAGNLEIVKFLINSGARINSTTGGSYALCLAIEHGSFEVVKFLVDEGADVNVVANIKSPLVDLDVEKYEWNPLYIAIRRGRHEILEFLIDRGAELKVNDLNGHQGTTLHMALSVQDEPKVAKILIEKGENVNIQDDSGQTALHYAVKRRWPSVVRLLLDYGASPDAKDYRETTPFDILTSCYEQKEMVKLLLSKLNPPPSLPANDWLLPLGFFTPRNLRFEFKEFLSVSVLPSPLAPYSGEGPRRFWFESFTKKGLDTLAKPPYQFHDVLNDPIVERFNRFHFSNRWWRKLRTVQEPYSDALRLLQHEEAWWYLELSSLPSIDLPRHLKHDEFFIESWFFVSCLAISGKQWPKPESLTLEDDTSIKKFEGFYLAMAPQAPESDTGNSSFERTWRVFRSLTTVYHARVERIKNVEDLIIPLIEKIDLIFEENGTRVSRQLSHSRLNVLRNGGNNRELLHGLLSDATLLENISENYDDIIRSLIELLDSVQRLGWGSVKNSRGKVKNLEPHREKMRALVEKSQNIIQLEFNLTSILEAQRSTITNRSMKRLTWVTVSHFAYK
ncbi:ankyrin repeat-containing domain protein [Rostrohypoxylon terebratum]|nr:ankyrin repeat-containing domain protein [Rostrohypoxylon terebratum]